ncbi:hypothetical protein TKK_0017024 [Trichogramma kaykai]
MTSYIASNLKILLWNARSILCKIWELRRVSSNYDIIACVESWLKPNHHVHLSGFHEYRLDCRHARCGGIVIWARKELLFNALELASSHATVELGGLRITNVNPQLDLIVCYRTPGSNLSQECWNQLMSVARADRAAILMGDFNARSTSWNCECSDENGMRLENAYGVANICLHNFFSSTFIDLRRRYHSNLDLVFSTFNISHLISTEISDDTMGSDHYTVCINIALKRHLHFQKKHRINSVRTDWAEVQRTLDEEYFHFLAPAYDHMDVTDKYNKLLDTITKTIVSHTPTRQLVSKRKHINPVPWWDSECDKANRLRLAAFKRYNHSLELCDLIEYNKRAAIMRSILKRRKKECFHRFAANLNFRSNPSHVWKVCKIFKNKWVNTKPVVRDSIALDEFDFALNKLCPPWAETNPDSMPAFIHRNQFFDAPFSYHEINAALESKRDSAAPGIDGIGFDVMKRLPPKYVFLLLDIFNEMHRQASFPDDWKKIFVIFIKKPSGSGLRPISLIPLNIESIIAAPNIQACVAVCEFLRRCSLRV